MTTFLLRKSKSSDENWDFHRNSVLPEKRSRKFCFYLETQMSRCSISGFKGNQKENYLSIRDVGISSSAGSAYTHLIKYNVPISYRHFKNALMEECKEKNIEHLQVFSVCFFFFLSSFSTCFYIGMCWLLWNTVFPSCF